MSVQQKVTLAVGLVLLLVLLWRLMWLAVYGSTQALTRLGARLPHSRVWARAHPIADYLAYRYPRSYGVVMRRIDPHSPSGLPMTLSVAAGLYVLLLIGGLIEELFEAEEIVAFDKAVNAYLDTLRASPFIDAFAWITTLGNSGTLVAVVLASTGFLWAHQRTYLIMPLWVTWIGAQATTYLGKFGIDRERPEFVTVVTAITPSFPSGHATGAMAVYGFVAYLIARELTGLRPRFEVVYWTVVVIGLVGFSRLYLSVHYASDVAAGFLVGAFWILVGFVLAEARRHRQRTS